MGGGIFLGSLQHGNFQRSRGRVYVEMESLEFVENSGVRGGAVASVRAATLSVASVNFTGNRGEDGGAMYVESDGDPDPQVYVQPDQYVRLQNTSFTSNMALHGGAMFLYVSSGTASLARVGASPSQISLVTSKGKNNNEDDVFFENSKFVTNNASESGGAVYVEKGRMGCRNCSFRGNFITQGLGGNGGAVYLNSQAAFHGRNTSFEHNEAMNGGSMYADDALIDLINSTIASNTAKLYGGGLYICIPISASFQFGLLARVSQTTMKNNTANVGGMSLICAPS